MQVYKVGIGTLAIGPLTSKLKSSLYIGQTLWLVPGGSNIPITVAIMEGLNTELSTNLIVGLTDERFGPPEHKDSNWFQLKDAGFDAKRARLIEPLNMGSTVEEITSNYATELANVFEEVSSAIGQFGMGQDGHIAGILPGSAAINATGSLVSSYTSDPFTRITLTFEGIRRLSSAFLVAFGEAKRPQLERLVNQDLPPSEQPAQIIKQVGESYLYNDQIGGKE